MSEQTLEDLNSEEFEKLVEAFIERDALGSTDLPMDMFFELWAQIEEERERETIELEGEVVGDQLVFSLPEESVSSVVVQDNQIFLGDRRIVVHLKDKSKAA